MGIGTAANFNISRRLFVPQKSLRLFKQTSARIFHGGARRRAYGARVDHVPRVYTSSVDAKLQNLGIQSDVKRFKVRGSQPEEEFVASCPTLDSPHHLSSASNIFTDRSATSWCCRIVRWCARFCLVSVLEKTSCGHQLSSPRTPRLNQHASSSVPLRTSKRRSQPLPSYHHHLSHNRATDASPPPHGSRRPSP